MTIYKTTLKQWIKDNAVNQTKLAEQLDINPTMFNRIVNGKYLPNLRTAQKIAHRLGKTVEELWPLPEEDEKDGD